jgi:sigma-B regulation protein RsbU (phosphoserine phosphatase)
VAAAFRDEPGPAEILTGGGLRVVAAGDAPAPAVPASPRRRLERKLAGTRRRCRRLLAVHNELVRQLDFAAYVHGRLLQHPLPAAPKVPLAAALRPVHHLAGDFFNAFRLDAHRVGLYIGDVMGHGPAAALLGLFAMQMIRTKRPEGEGYAVLGPDAVLAGLNVALQEADIPGSPFLTMAYGVLDTESATWTYCGAGHPPGLLLRAGAPPQLLDSNSPLLGVVDLPFQATCVPLEAGDRLLLYSDGAETAHWAGGGPGLAGLAAVFAERRCTSLQQEVDDALAGLTFPPGAPADDVALMLAEFRPGA